MNDQKSKSDEEKPKQSKMDELLIEEVFSNNQDRIISAQKRLNILFDKMYDLNIENAEKIKSYKKPVNQSFEKIILLNDKRILFFSQDIIVVHDLENNKSFFKEVIGLSDIAKLSNGNLIAVENKKMKLIEVKETDISIVKEWDFENKKKQKIYVLSNGYILDYAENINFIFFYKYENNELILSHKGICTQKSGIDSVCQINENEIAVTCWESRKFFGNNYFLIFYDINKKTEIQTIDIGGKLCLLNENYLIVASTSRIYLIDLEKHKILTKILAKYSKSKKYSLVKLKEDSFLIIADNIYQYDVKNEKIIYKGLYIFNANLAIMISKNKLLLENLSGLTVFEFPEKIK